ncbi:circadian clock-controlled protein daywake [Manduca sexta]|uniref:Uncharacterized protein n=1 Tax=Manduca sexta TaxID=7130 RepID=A0A921ZAR9_MANSE|nr:circadian clock-controlled protein daywake [Manduca sexta]KAG6454223.1 hypothetical protein O3G_MSEX008581 [Manduca sexta]
MSPAQFIVTFFCIVAGVSAMVSTVAPCDLEDKSCITNSFKISFQDLVNGIPTMGVNSSDPIEKKKILGILPKLKYTLTDVTFSGLKDCEVREAFFTPDHTKFIFTVICPRLVTKGHYDAKGQLLNFDVFGKGNIEINSYGFNMTFKTDIEMFKDCDDKDHMKIKDYKLQLNDKAFVTHELSNLFNGDKARAEAVTKVMSANWRRVSEEAEAPAMYSLILVFIKNMNNYFEGLPLEEIFYKISQ